MTTMTEVARVIPRPRDTGTDDPMPRREWLVTNGLGGFAAGTVAGVVTRRYHGLLVASQPAPLGRVVMLNHLLERVRVGRNDPRWLGDENDVAGPNAADRTDHLREFRLELGLPVWRYEIDGVEIEKRVLMPHEHNTVHVSYRLVRGQGPVRLSLRPSVHFRQYDAPVNASDALTYRVEAHQERYELCATPDWPSLRMLIYGRGAALTLEARGRREVPYHMEKIRGYEAEGVLWSPGYFRADLTGGQTVTLVASTEPWDVVCSLRPDEALVAEQQRRRSLLALAGRGEATGLDAELVLAADQFIITPAGRAEEAARARAMGEEVRTVIAGYHWFTDWGRDTMISLEGLALCTGREREAGYILRTFGHYVRDGLIPNMFPEGTRDGLYHTADATLWFFHAIHRYLQVTGERSTLRQLLPTLTAIVEHHVRGTRFGIGVDPRDGLLGQGEEGYQLTWMDAKVDGWVVTPRRGKAVEINALWYNALRLLAGWLRDAGDPGAREIDAWADRAAESFNRRFWYAEGGHLYDVVDGEQGDDPACRPNQILAVSLDHPVLARERWEPVFEVVRQRLLTPVGLRSLAPGHRDYKPQYYGDLRARDAAYHQGTVWGWLVGPFVDAWLRLHPDDRAGARQAALEGFAVHLSEAGLGTLSEIFDGEAPYAPRGCMAQAWSVAEVLRAWLLTEPAASVPATGRGA